MDAIGLLESFWQDLRYAARLLRLNPGFLAVATLSLVLGIGANTAIFQLLDAVRLRMLPVAHPEQLVELKIAKNEHCCSGDFSDRQPNFTYPQWEQIRTHQQAFSGIFAWGDQRFNTAGAGDVHYVEGLWVSGGFFQTLGVQPIRGRLIADDDDRPGCGAPGVVISHAYWQRELGGEPNVTGKTLSLDGHRLPIMGIAPANFFGVDVGRNFDVAVPTCAEPLINGENSHLAKRNHWWLAIIGRLKPGWNVARADAQARAMSSAVFETTVPPNYRPDEAKYYTQYKLSALAAGSGVSGIREQYQEPLLLLLGIAGMVLLIACANLANLMLARASARGREIAVRMAMGAGRNRVIRQLLTESLLLTLIGTAAGAVLAHFLSRYLVGMLTTNDNPLFIETGIDWRVFGFTAGVAILTCLLFGLTPALRATRTDPQAAMKASGRGLTSDRERFGLRRALVISQIALSLVLMTGGLLFVRSLRNLLTNDPGFREDGVLIASIDISRLNVPVSARGEFYRNVLERVRATPGVQQAATANIVQASGYGWNESVEIPGLRKHDRMVPWFDRVSTDYFAAMGTPLLAGRDFDERDTPTSPEVGIVNQEFSKKFLGGANPIGRQVRVLTGPGEPQRIYQIVGLVKSSKYASLRDNFVPTVYVAASQERKPSDGSNFIIHSSVPPASLMSAVRKTLLDQDAGMSIQFQVYRTQLRESLLQDRLMATLSGFFGFLAALMAAAGLYGVMSYMVARRRNEIGIRMALGANRTRVLKLVLREAGVLLLFGLAAGTAVAIAVTRIARSMLFGLEPGDPLTFSLAILMLAAIAAMASLLPAIRASRLEPMAALREE
jgi:putative ABC transport system permease protein